MVPKEWSLGQQHKHLWKLVRAANSHNRPIEQRTPSLGCAVIKLTHYCYTFQLFPFYSVINSGEMNIVAGKYLSTFQIIL